MEVGEGGREREIEGRSRRELEGQARRGVGHWPGGGGEREGGPDQDQDQKKAGPLIRQREPRGKRVPERQPAQQHGVASRFVRRAQPAWGPVVAPRRIKDGGGGSRGMRVRRPGWMDGCPAALDGRRPRRGRVDGGRCVSEGGCCHSPDCGPPGAPSSTTRPLVGRPGRFGRAVGGTGTESGGGRPGPFHLQWVR